jgi:hypothetical protein
MDQIIQYTVGYLGVYIGFDGFKSNIMKIHGSQGGLYRPGIGGNYFGYKEPAVGSKAA